MEKCNLCETCGNRDTDIYGYTCMVVYPVPKMENGMCNSYEEEETVMETRRELPMMPYDKAFDVDGNEELCHATGYEVLIDGEWWNEYVDSENEFHYGR